MRVWVHNNRKKLYPFIWIYYLLNFGVWQNLFLEDIADDYTRWIYTMIGYFFIIFCPYSHWVTSTTECRTFKRHKTIFHDKDSYNVCMKCEMNAWKPNRTHHCSVCGNCVTKMDHHCPLAMNCIGSRNHKSFLNMIMYHSIATGFFLGL